MFNDIAKALLLGVPKIFSGLKVYQNLSEYSPLSKAIVTVGTFDGVHIGHQKLLSTINELAIEEGGESVLLTFSPHPRLVLFPDDDSLRLLNDLNEKIKRLEKTGIQHLIIHPFTLDFSRTTALEYVRDMLVKGIGVHKLVIGYDHHFGKDRSGNLENLKVLAPKYQFEVTEISAQEIDDVNVSSTKIRNALLAGDISLANHYLGYHFMVTGKVISGQELGRSLGFPTANIELFSRNKLVPGNGVYACRILLNGVDFDGMVNIGVRPTVSDAAERHIEVNIFNLDQDIYGNTLQISFVSRLRDEMKFENLEALKSQLSKDAAHAKTILADPTISFD